MSRPFVFAFSYVPHNVCHTTLLPDPVYTLSVLQGDSYHDSLHLPLGCGQFFKLGIAKRPGLTATCHYWEYTISTCFPFQSHWQIFVLHDVVQLVECTPSLSNSTFHFLYLVIVLSHHLPKIYISVDLNLLFIDNHILVDMLVTYYFSFPQICILRPTGLLMSSISWSISCSFKVELAMRTILSAKIRWDKYLPSILTLFFSNRFVDDGVLQTRHREFGRDAIPLSGSSSKLEFFAVIVVVELMLPRYRGFAGCLSTLYQRPGYLAIQRVVKILCCQRLFHNRRRQKKWDVVHISLLLQLVYHP